MLDMMQMRNYITLDGKQTLQYRYKYPLGINSIEDYPPEAWFWSEWKNVEDEKEIVYFKGFNNEKI